MPHRCRDDPGSGLARMALRGQGAAARLRSTGVVRRSGGTRSLGLAIVAALTGLIVSATPVSMAPDRSPEAQARPRTDRDARFGLNQAWEKGEVADLAGAGWSRLTFWWGQFQPRGPSDWNLFATDHDSYIDDELARGRELAGVVLNTPLWASTNGNQNGVPRNVYLPWDHPDNYWGQFMWRLAQHYRGKINTWVIWNEVDIPAGIWQTFEGSIDDYVQVLRVAYRAAKAGNPQARVAHYGSPWWYDHGEYLTQVLDRLAADPEGPAHNHYFDIGNLHLYSRANDIPRLIPWYREQLAVRGMADRPLWIGETNAIPYDDPLWPERKAGFRATMDEQASYLIEAFATYIALGVERIGVNRLRDGEDFEAGGEPFGLLRNDGSTRPAFKAFQVITRYFAGARPVSYHATDATGLTKVVLERDSERITVAWTLKPEPLEIAIEGVSPVALLVSKYGTPEVLLAEEDGRYRFELAPATTNSNEADPLDYVVGGDPVILVERFDGEIPAARPL